MKSTFWKLKRNVRRKKRKGSELPSFLEGLCKKGNFEDVRGEGKA